MNRRAFLGAAMSTLLAARLAAEAQTAEKQSRVGVLLNSSTTTNLDDLRQGLRDLGYVEGQTIVLETVSAEGKLDRLPALAGELVRRNVDVIVTSGPSAVAAARKATSTIPIVMGRMDDVDLHGFVANLARPGGNITGISFQTSELAGKWVHLVKEAVPSLSRLALMWDVTGTAGQRQTAHDAARTLGMHVELLEVKGAAGLADAVGRARASGAEALVILAAPALTVNVRRLIALITEGRLPAIYYSRSFAEAGGLMSYGPDAADFNWRRAAAFVDKIIKGARPGDLPIEQPTKFELLINLRTARAFRLTIPPSLLLRADRVLE